MKLVTRTEWGAREPKSRTPLNPDALKGIALHYSAAQTDEQVSHDNCASRVRWIQDYHMDTKGWADLAYSYAVCKHGYVFEGRGTGIRPAAQGTAFGNDSYHAVCFLGDDTIDRDDVTRTGRRALVSILLELQDAYPIATQLRPHSSFVATACPGDQLRTWLVELDKVLI